MLLKRTLPLLSVLLLTQSARSAVTFSFDYSDPSATAWSNDAKAALNTAASNMAAYMPGYTATITMKVTGSNVNSTNLASAGSYFYNLASGFGNKGEVATKIQSNGTIDIGGSNFDGLVDANFFHSWSFTNTVGGSSYDFINVMMHELSHAMGFAGLIAQNGGSVFGSSNTTAQGFYSPWDQNLVDGSGTPMVGATFVTDGAWTTASVGGTGTVPATPNSGLYFGGTNAMAANGGNLVPIYSPTTWQNGSSASHVDTNFYTGGNVKLMNHAVSTGLGVRALSAIEVGVFKDLGYTLMGSTSVPEPTSTLLVLVSLGFFARRKR